MRRSVISLGIMSLGVLSMAIRPHQPMPQPPPPATAPSAAPGVPTARRIVTTPPAAKPAAPPAAPSAPAAPAASSSAAPSVLEQARAGVVSIERQGKAVALGFVLEGDGRILTALSPLATGNFLSVRYADGKTAPLKVVVSDRGWDLALVAAQAATPPAAAAAPPAATTAAAAPPAPARAAGLRAARSPSFVGLSSFGLTAPATIVAAPATLKLAAGLQGGDATSLVGGYELGWKPALVGAPVVNPEGEVVAIVARACPSSSGAACVPTPYGAPVTAIKQFLQRVPAEASWLGIAVAADEVSGIRGARVVSVSPNGPAAVAGLRPGASPIDADLVVAVDGAPIASAAALTDAVRAHQGGDGVELLVFGLGRYRHVSIRPRALPDTGLPFRFPTARPPRLPNPYR